MKGVLYPIKTSLILSMMCMLCSVMAYSDALAAPLAHFFDTSAGGNQHAYCDKTGSGFVAGTIICNFVSILDSVLTQVYNGIQAEMVPVVEAALTLYVAVFGAQLLMGTTQLQGGEVVTRLLKVGGVWAFSTNWQYGVNILFYFYMGFIADAGMAIINSLINGQTNSICAAAFPVISAGYDPGNAMPLFTFFDGLIACALAGPVATANTKVAGFFMAVALVFPPLTMMFSWWLQTTLFALARAVLSFLTGLAVIAFLVALSPIFLSLMLFEATRQFFESWMRYIIAYSVQIVLVFGIVVIWIMILFQLIYFLNDLSNDILPIKSGQVGGSYLEKTDTWGICDMDFSNFARPLCKACGGSSCIPHTPYEPPAVCNAPCTGTPVIQTSDLIPPTKIINQGNFLDYVFTNLGSLLILSYAFAQLLDRANEIAGGIANGGQPMPLAGGWGNRGMGSATEMKNITPPGEANAPAAATSG